MSRDFDKATADMNKYLELNSGNLSARVRNAQFLFLVKKYPESLREIDALQAQGVKNVVLQRIRAYDLVEQGDTVNTIPAFESYFAEQVKEKVIASDLEYYGKALALVHQDSLAGEKMLEAARMDKTKDYLFIDAGKAFSKAKAYDRAIDAYREKMKTGKLEVNDWYYLGNAANKAKRYTMADSAWAEYIIKQPNIYQGYLYRARAQAGLDSAEVKTWTAKPFYEEVIRKMKPEEQVKSKADLEEAYNYMGLYYLYNKENMDRAKAKCFFEKVAALGANTSITKQVNETFLKMKELKDLAPGTCDVL
jgi:predicted Zn-dependent protease